MRNVIIGLLGTKLDQVRGSGAWQPTVKLCAHPDFPIDRLELLYPDFASPVLERVLRDIRTLSPDTEVRAVQMNFDDPWDLQEVYGKLYDFAATYGFDEDRERYYIHLTTGTHVAQICWFLLGESRHIPAWLIQMEPPRQGMPNGRPNIIDLDLSRYDALQRRFEAVSREHSHLLRGGIETRHPGLARLTVRLERIALSSDAPVLVVGEAGTGKSTLAARIYEMRLQRRLLRGKLVRTSGLLLGESQGLATLVGQKRNVLGVAGTERAGLLAEADRGILLIDGVEHLPPAARAVLARVIETGLYRPLGAEADVQTQLQVVATARSAVGLEALFPWVVALPSLRERAQDWEVEFDHALHVAERRLGVKIGFAAGAKAHYLRFARSAEALWSENCRDLMASVLRLCTLAERGRVTMAMIEEEIAQLSDRWAQTAPDADYAVLAEVLDAPEAIDAFDRPQLAAVIRACRRARSLSDAGRMLFAVSRTEKASRNDSDRLRKYLARFSLTWDCVRVGGGPSPDQLQPVIRTL